MKMAKVFPDNHWTLQVDIPYSMGLACHDLIFLCGQADLEGEGKVGNPEDLIAQSKSAIRHINNLFAELGASLENLVKLVVFYVPDEAISQDDYIAALAEMVDSGNRPVTTLVPVPRMFHPGVVVEIDAYGMLDRQGKSIEKHHCWPEGHWDWPIHLPFKHGLRYRNLVFTGGQVSMNTDAEIIDPGQMANRPIPIWKIWARYWLNSG